MFPLSGLVATAHILFARSQLSFRLSQVHLCLPSKTDTWTQSAGQGIALIASAPARQAAPPSSPHALLGTGSGPCCHSLNLYEASLAKQSVHRQTSQASRDGTRGFDVCYICLATDRPSRCTHALIRHALRYCRERWISPATII